MDMIIFTGGGHTEALRPTHALQVAAEIDGRAVTGTTLAGACDRVRERYRCRTVRKELRRVRLLGEAAGDALVGVACDDGDMLASFGGSRQAA